MQPLRPGEVAPPPKPSSPWRWISTLALSTCSDDPAEQTLDTRRKSIHANAGGVLRGEDRKLESASTRPGLLFHAQRHRRILARRYVDHRPIMGQPSSVFDVQAALSSWQVTEAELTVAVCRLFGNDRVREHAR